MAKQVAEETLSLLSNKENFEGYLFVVMLSSCSTIWLPAGDKGWEIGR
jgi:hypothetical protein